jgi:hypothetical protein
MSTIGTPPAAEQRACILLNYGEISQVEIARMLGISTGCIFNRVTWLRAYDEEFQGKYGKEKKTKKTASPKPRAVRQNFGMTVGIPPKINCIPVIHGKIKIPEHGVVKLTEPPDKFLSNYKVMLPNGRKIFVNKVTGLPKVRRMIVKEEEE